jgi:hypothetical protein
LSKIRELSWRPLTRTSENKGNWQHYDPVLIF